MRVIDRGSIVAAVILVLILLFGCSGVDPAEFERSDNKRYTPTNTNVIVDTTEVYIPPTISSPKGLTIEIQKEIPIPPTHRAVAWKDYGEDIVIQTVDLQFALVESYSALIVTHHMWDYTVSAEFPIIGGWVETLGIDGNIYTNKVRWTDGSTKTIAIKYKGDELSTISIGQRVFYLREVPPVRREDIINISPEGNRGEHIVQRGENANLIAKKYNISITQLRELNPGIKDLSLIQPGDALKVEY